MTHGYGLWVRGGGRAELERVVVESNHCAGAVAEDSGSVLRLSDAAIVGTRGQELDGVFGYGLATWLKASVELRRVAVERNHMYGMLVVEEGTSATLTDVVLRETEAQENDGTRGQGLYVVWGATAQARRVLLERNRLFGVAVESAGTSVTLDDLVVRDTRVQEADGWGGVGLAAYDSAQVELGRALVAGNRMAGLQCLDAGTLCRAHDLVVRDTTGILGGRGGNGLQVVGGARAELARSVFERNRTASLVVTDERSSLGFEDGVVRDTRPQEADNSGGHGLIANVGASVDLTRCLFQRNRSCEILADGTGTTLAATDIVVRDARSNASDGEHGRCLDVQYGARAKVLRAKLSRCRNIAVAAFNPGSSVVMSDVEVLDTLESECAIGSCAGVGVGTGVGSYAGAKVEVTRFIVSGSVLAGVQLAYGSERLPDGERRYYPDAGTIDLHEGEISHNLVGAHIEGEGFDIYRLMDRVIYRDNGRNLDTNELPVPDMALPPEW